VIRVTEKGVRFVTHWEGFEPCPYKDPVGVWTRGYGETKGIGPNSPCVTEDEARHALRRRLSTDYLPSVPRKRLMKAQERDALASFAYNLGPAAVGNVDYSALAKRLRSREGLTFKGRKRIYREEMRKWVKAGGKTLEGLEKRREAEMRLACYGDYGGRP
jgi:lysozyme